MSENKELAFIPPKEKAISVYAAENGLDPYLAIIRAEIDSFVPDASTAKGRKEIISMAAKVAKSKVALDDMGKSLVAELKEKPKLIDAERKRMRDMLDLWRDETRKPVTDWEAEQARIEAERLAAEESEKLRVQIENDHEIAILMNEKHDREIAEAEAEAERKRIAYETEIAQKAKEQAIAEEKQRQVDAENSRITAQAKLEADRMAEQKRKVEEVQAERQRLESERLAAELKAKQAEERAAQAIDQERQRVENERLEAERIKAEKEKNRANVGKKRKEAKEALMLNCGLTEDQAKAVVLAVSNKLITNIQINY